MDIIFKPHFKIVNAIALVIAVLLMIGLLKIILDLNVDVFIK
jgi:hypothetical protein